MLTDLSEIYGVIAEARKLVGGRLIILECEDVPGLIGVYESAGFSRLQIDASSNNLITMYKVVSD